MVIKYILGFLLLFALMIIASCNEDITPTTEENGDLTEIPYEPIAYQFSIPDKFPRIEQPSDNLATIEGINLGRHLFYDPILSVDSTISCASCHLPNGSFTDNSALSEGVDGALGKRSSMSLLNVAFYNRGLFWDGREATLESQALVPVEDIHEMANMWSEVEGRLKVHKDYPLMFRKAFGIENKSKITRLLAAKALAQFQRTIVSSGLSKYDRVELGIDVYTDEELLGRDLFFDENPSVSDAECNHCHSVPLMTANDYFNNGLDEVPDLNAFNDFGLGKVTGKISDNGKFRAPTLRNIEFSAPYMHDGRFNTLKEVIEHYNSGGKSSLNKDPLIRPLGLTEEYKKALIAFIRTMEEPDLMSREELQNPFE